MILFYVVVFFAEKNTARKLDKLWLLQNAMQLLQLQQLQLLQLQRCYPGS
jgi:hypothetical protein